MIEKTTDAAEEVLKLMSSHLNQSGCHISTYYDYTILGEKIAIFCYKCQERLVRIGELNKLIDQTDFTNEKMVSIYSEDEIKELIENITRHVRKHG